MNAKKIILTLLLIISFVLFYTWQRIEVLRLGYEVDKLRSEKNELYNKNKFLQVKVAGLKSLDRVEKIAREELGLIIPDKFEIISLEEVNEKESAGVE